MKPSQKTFHCCASQQGQDAHIWQPLVIPTKGLPFRDSKPVPSKA